MPEASADQGVSPSQIEAEFNRTPSREEVNSAARRNSAGFIDHLSRGPEPLSPQQIERTTDAIKLWFAMHRGFQVGKDTVPVSRRAQEEMGNWSLTFREAVKEELACREESK